LKVFLTEIGPILDYYGKQGKLVRVDGNLDVEGVAGGVVSALRAPSHAD